MDTSTTLPVNLDSYLRRLPFLDPRHHEEAATRPIKDAVNIPLAELDQRIHELPPPHEIIEIAADAELAHQSQTKLATHKRQSRIVPFEHAEATRGRLWEPNALILEQAARQHPGKALDLGCGTGRDAIYLASGGWKVWAVDHLPDALERGRLTATRLLEQHADRIEWRPEDIEEATEPDEQFDLVSAFFFMSPKVLAYAIKAVKPGGWLLIESFTPTHREARGKPKDPSPTLNTEEASKKLQSFEITQAGEGWRADRHTLRLIAQKRL